jgi:DNA-binding NtrC family response regulator
MADSLNTLTDCAPAPNAQDATPWAAVVVHPVERIVSVPLRTTLTLGRTGGEGLDLALADRALSRRHVRLLRVGGQPGCGIEDLGSKNGTFVGGERVRRRAIGPHGGIVRIGQTVLYVGPVAVPGARPRRNGGMVGRSAALVDALAVLDRVATTRIGVLILGETGTGKELAAERLHAASGRPGTLVAVNCSTLPEHLADSLLFGHVAGSFTGARSDHVGKIAASDGGTLFLDEVDTLPPAVQAKLLRVLELGRYHRLGDHRERGVDLRVVAATHADLNADHEGFRSDLYARLAGVVLRLPPLRERREDIVVLARHFTTRERTWSAGFVEALCSHRWPLNVRGLRSLIGRVDLLIDADTLEARHLEGLLETGSEPAAADPSGAPGAAQLRAMLEAHRGRISRVAEELGKDRRQVYRWLAKHGLDPADFRG